MSNIESFMSWEELQKPQHANELNAVLEKYNEDTWGALSQNEQANKLGGLMSTNETPQPEGGETNMGPTATEEEAGQAAAEALEAKATADAEVGQADIDHIVPGAAPNGNNDNANYTKIVPAEAQDGDVPENEQPNEENGVRNFETPKSQHELGMEDGKNNGNSGVDPKYTTRGSCA